MSRSETSVNIRAILPVGNCNPPAQQKVIEECVDLPDAHIREQAAGEDTLVSNDDFCRAIFYLKIGKQADYRLIDL